MPYALWKNWKTCFKGLQRPSAVRLHDELAHTFLPAESKHVDIESRFMAVRVDEVRLLQAPLQHLPLEILQPREPRHTRLNTTFSGTDEHGRALLSNVTHGVLLAPRRA